MTNYLRISSSRFFAVLLAVVCSSAFADPGSTLSGRTVGSGVKEVQAEVGWPGVTGQFLFGAGEKLDVGARLSLLYGGPINLNPMPGAGLQGVLRYSLLDTGQVSLAVRTEPGVAFFADAGGGVSVLLPLMADAGFHLTPSFTVLAGLDVTPTVVYLFKAGGAGFTVPILVGGGAEYQVSDKLALTFHLRAGPNIYSFGPLHGVNAGLRMGVGASIKL